LAGHESAIKEAETDAMKRAFMTFGNPFGLALYDKQQTNVADEGDESRALVHDRMPRRHGQVWRCGDVGRLVNSDEQKEGPPRLRSRLNASGNIEAGRYQTREELTKKQHSMADQSTKLS